ncbi:MAG: response regulator [Deltaproteobacteria bacterium]|nr:response regulator transcription factor [Deltaproteobacteria bacterium]MBW2077867.1 response regulator transcription factor [Deltaproteobacteria bacterium]RLB28948.1 MAG: response regulator [Deltaproteobacteria bacterium]
MKVEQTEMTTILIVEANALIRRSFREILCRQFPSVSVEEAEDMGEAMEKVQNLRPALIFVDIKVRGGHGLSLTKKIKSQFPSTTIAMITPYDLPEYRKAAVEWGANFFLSKCCSSRKEIVEVAHSVISKKSKTNTIHTILP